MKVVTSGEAVIKHASTGANYTISANQLDWDVEGHASRNMGDELRYFAEFHHDDLGVIAWEIYEYPIGIENQKLTNVGGHTLIQDISYGLEHVPDVGDE